MSDSSTSSTDAGTGGNTITPVPKQISPAKRWCFTLNNYTEEDLSSIKSTFDEEGAVVCVGMEVGENNTPHLQGYVEFSRKLRPLSLGLNRGIHWEKSKGTRKQNFDYCRKQGAVWFEKGDVPKAIKVIDNLYGWQSRLVDAIKEEPDERTIRWIWSEGGGLGKTSFQKYLVVKHNAIVLGGKASDCRNGVVEYMKANWGKTPELVCINIPRSYSADFVSYEAFENIKDMCFYSGKYEGGMVVGNPPHLLVFANFEPDKEKMSADRWRIENID